MIERTTNHISMPGVSRRVADKVGKVVSNQMPKRLVCPTEEFACVI